MKSYQLRYCFVIALYSLTTACSNTAVKENSPTISTEQPAIETIDRPRSEWQLRLRNT